MSFASPIFLLALLAVPALLLLQHAARRRAQRYALRFPAVGNAELAAAAGPPAWRRYVPTVLALLAFSALAFALAKPQRTVGVQVRKANIILVLDHSGSMQAEDVSPT